MERLLATGNAKFTHNQDDSEWKTEFPRILMEVRDELRSAFEQNNPSEYTNYSGVAPVTITTAEEWSKKEGWSIKYYQDKVFPKINEAW